ncbi:hypothetical protein [Pseudotenacibaculum haliotis]|uniref:Uncharacterized protein n=1 Tax=Pseudotenacibaculum haliotis TaxID=1862138 RepID=A0ABW5LU61_9FLAO
MDFLTLCVTFISLLLGISYPILTQITSEDKYSSEAILDLFENSPIKKYFKVNLIVSLCLTLLAYLDLPPLLFFNIGWLDDLIGFSAKILLISFTILLIINFFRLINLIQIFYRTSRLIDYLYKLRGKVTNQNDFISFEGMTDILFWTIQNQNLKVALRVSEYFYEVFHQYRENWKKDKDENKEGLIYPELFYNMIYHTIEENIKNDHSNFKFIEARTSGLTWLLGEFDTPKISERTYSWLWRNIVLEAENDRFDLIFMHWSSAHQYFQMNLEHLTPEYDSSGEELTIKNQSSLDERIKDRERFLEFHYALGGLLLFKNKIEFIKKLFNYTTSQPPDYYLLPIHMNQVFNMFFKFFDPYERNFPWITRKYYFPGLDGIGAQRVIKNWICQYIAILYLRQFNIQTFYGVEFQVENPVFPDDISEKRYWIENIKYFKEIIIAKTDDQNLIDILGFSLTHNYKERLNEIEEKLKDDFNTTEMTAVPEDDKVNLFYTTIKKFLDPIFKTLALIKNDNEEIEEEKSKVYFIRGQSNLTSKGSFTENGITNLNFHSFLPEIILDKIKKNLSSIFFVNTSEHYYVNQEDTFKAIDNLKINSDEHIIILFGIINFSYYINNLNIGNLKKDSYKGIKIIHIPTSVKNVGTSFFVLKKAHLPWINFSKIDDEYLKLYELVHLDSDYNIYGTVSDLNTNDSLRELIIKEGKDTEADLKKHVYQGINFKTKLKFDKKIKLVRIEVKGRLHNLRKTNNPNEIRKL